MNPTAQDPASVPADVAVAFASTPTPSPDPKAPSVLIHEQVTQSSLEKDKSQSGDQIRRLGEKIDAASLPADLHLNLIERISRLALIRASSGFMSASYILEYESTANYINWVVSLPWHTESPDLLDLVRARQILDKNHYGLEPIKVRILEYLATIILNLKNGQIENIQRAPILCLVGLAGTGKTTLAKSIAEALGRAFERIPFGGMADARVLRGQSRAFADAEPGLVIKKLAHAKTNNPVILLDELDRVTEASRADIMGVLVELLDPEQNYAFTDHYVDFPFNLANVLFVSTANNTTAISTAVMDRLEVIQMPSYSDDEKIVIGKKYLFSQIRQKTGLKPEQISISDTVWPMIIRPLGFDSGIRTLERTIDTICRRVARLIVEGKVQSVNVDEKSMKYFLPT